MENPEKTPVYKQILKRYINQTQFMHVTGM